MEHGPAVPDVLVENPPAVKASGEDPQLRRAVETLLQEIDDEPVAPASEEDRE
jgi:tricorn protease